MRDDMTTKYVLKDAGLGGILLFQFLNDGVVDNVTSFVNSFDIRFVRSTDDDV
jgi:hypothetical protein